MQGAEALTPGMEYYSILVPEKAKGYQRFDFCLACWEASAKNQFHATAKTAWKAKVASKIEKEDLSSKSRDERALILLKEALQNKRETEWAEVFILALYLARRKILYLRQELLQDDGSVLCIYEEAATEEMLPVRRRSLKHINIADIQSRIAKKLNLKTA